MTKEAADYSLRIFWSFARWIEDTKGIAALEEVAASGGVRAADFDGSTRWVSHAQVERILAAGYELAGDDATFKSAFAHRFEEGYGPYRYMIWAVSLEKMCLMAVHMGNKILTNAGRFECLYSSGTTFGLRYVSTQPESRLMCISRQIGWLNAPRFRGGASGAEVIEHSCIAKGDASCDYHFRWSEERALAPVVIGLGAGVAAALGAGWLASSYTSAALYIALPLLGAVLGHVRELHRIAKASLAHTQANGEAMRCLGEAEAETRSEITALQQRQQEWSRRMEEEAIGHTRTLERVVQGLNGLQQSRETSIRGFSHDLRNPLFVVRANTQLLRERSSGAVDDEILGDMDEASLQIEFMLSKLMEVATAETGHVKLVARAVVVAPLAEVLRRRLKALVHGRSIDVSVVCDADAPESITIDPLVFDRVIDNLLTNAAKYTDCGSIKLAIRGGGDHLTLELSDTGRGVPAAKLGGIFRPRPADEPSGPNSYGIGLSSAVRLLAQVGGRLEVRSEPGVGSTFTALFPRTPSERKRGSTNEDIDSIITQVVKVKLAS